MQQSVPDVACVADIAPWTPGWDMVSALATVAATIAIVLAIRQFRFEAWLKAEELIRSFHKDRAEVFFRLPTCTAPWSEQEKAHALDVCRRMNTVAYLLQFLPRREVLEHWDDPLAKAWVVLEPVVRDERARARWNNKWIHFEIWGKRALKKLVVEGRDPRNEANDMNRTTESSVVEAAQARWLDASKAASKLAGELFQPGTGYGASEARAQDEHRLESARLDAERLFREYHDLDRREMERNMLELQRSQRVATWASFAVAAVVGLATVVNTLVALFK